MIDLARARQILTFGAVGLFNTAAYFILANWLHSYLGLDSGLVSYVAYLVLVPLSFLAHRRLTFASDGRASVEWRKFCLVQATNLFIIWCVTLASHQAQWAGWVSFATISVLIPMLNFVVLQLWVFARRMAS